MHRHLVGLALFLLTISAVSADESSWPRVVETAEGTVTIYQPQIESFTGDTLEARAAVAVKMPDSEGPVFGAVWYSARVSTDRDERLVYVEDITVPLVRFPEASEEEKDRLARFLEKQIPESDLTISLDRLLAGLDMDDTAEGTAGLKSDPPVILFSTSPAILVTLDGEPVLKDMKEIQEGLLQQVVNTPFLMVTSRNADGFFLSAGGDLWYSAAAAEGPWEVAGRIPPEVASLIPADEETPEGDPPRVIVATEPTELVVADGEPNWSPVEGMDLLYMDNTDSDVFLDIQGQSYYLLLSGRWFKAAAMNDGLVWEHVANDDLPDAFADIGEDSVNGGILPHVAGTDQAREAVLDSTIPQTAAIRLDSEGVTIEYDGTPDFVDVTDVEGLKYAVNTEFAVFRVGNDYFACEQAVWYKSLSPIGPWTVATEIPVLLYQIPPSNPHYNVIYVKVYQVTPEVVYVGYTSGYVHSYHYHGCVVYGTGWWYRPWYGHYYYPRVSTWGFRVSYNPWYGWGVGIGWSNGPFTVSIGRHYGGYYRRGWFGPVGYRPRYRRAVHGGYHKTNVNVNINTGGGNRPGSGGGNRPGGGGDGPGGGTRPETRPSNNLYNKPENSNRNAQRPETSDRQNRGTASPGKNDVYSDKNGNVYRRDDKGQWEQRDQGQWKSAENLDRAGGGSDRSRPSGGAESRPSTPSQQPGTTRPSQPSTPSRQPGTTQPSPPSTTPGAGSGTRPSTGGGDASRPSTGAGSGSRPSTGAATRPGLESSHTSRQRGTQRSNSYQRSRSSGGSRGGSRGGGGRRR
jgi:hypothetical protein